MRKTTVCVALLALLILTVAGRTTFSYGIDRGVYAPFNYLTFLPPATGESYIDPAFGTSITRVSDAMHTPYTADTGTVGLIVNEYSTMTPFNSDNSRMVVQHRSYFALYDGAGHYLNDLPFDAASEPRWSRRDPAVLYYRTGNQLRQHDTATRTSSIVHTFSEYSAIDGRGESDICFDGDHLVLVGDFHDIFVYEISTDTKRPVLAAAPGAFDNVYITPDDHVLVSWYAHGEGRYNGVELFDGDMNFLRQVSPVMGHMDVTRDVDGSEVALVANAAFPNPPPGCQNAVVKVRLADGRQTCVISLDWSLSFHVSATDDSGWAVISTYAAGDPMPLTGWAAYTNEILQVKLDGSEVRRLAHHRSRPFNGYWWTPRASVSRDGSRLLFSSNYGLPAIAGYPGAYMDLYLISLSSTRPSLTGSDNPIAAHIEEDAAAAQYSCPQYSTWYTNTVSLHSGGSARLAMTPGCRVTFTFFGSGVRWTGYRDEWSGTANVYIDGVLDTVVDTYAHPSRWRAALFSRDGLSLGTHSVAIEVTSERNPASGGSWIWVDAFDVTVRVEQDDPAVQYSCPPNSTWVPNVTAMHSGGSAVMATTPGCQATFTFTGSAVSWIGDRDEWTGIARVSVDGVFRAEVDTYASPSAARAVIYTLTGFSPGSHALTIEATGRWNPASHGLSVWVDAFQIVP